MGGEFLTSLEENETEICRIVLQSTTLDTTSIRAKLIHKIYHFSVVDEYEVFNYQLPIKSSETPLKTSQILEQIDNCLVTEADEGGTYQFHGIIDAIISSS